MKHIFLGPRAPKDAKYRTDRRLRSLLACFFGVVIGTPFLVVISASTNFSYAHYALFSTAPVVLFHLWLERKITKFSWANTTEMAIGGSLFYFGFVMSLDSFWYLLCFAGFAAHVRPYLEGPEPDGWEPFIQKEEENKKRAEEGRLKGRRE